MPTRGQVKRAITWIDYLARPRLKRTKKSTPRCVTCGREPDGDFAKGEPRYDCQHEPVTISDADLERGRRELRR